MTATPAHVSVIIPTKNRSALLREALASVRALNGEGITLEIIVVDNGSVDDTEAVAHEFGARFVRALTPGAAAARNAGLRVATGEFLSFLDDDDLWTPGHLLPHVRLLADRPELGAVMGQIVLTDVERQPILSPYPSELPSSGDVFPRLLAAFPQIGAVVTRASVRHSVGYFDETLMNGEDWDWMLRLALRHSVGFIPAPSVYFRVRPAGDEDEDRLNWQRAADTRTVFWRNVRRAGRRRPSAISLARIYLRYRGQFASHLFTNSVVLQRAGKYPSARRSTLNALRISPLHTCWAVLHRSEVRMSMLRIATQW